MDLGLRGRTLLSQQVEYAVGLRLSDGFFVRIESPFTLDLPERCLSLSPEDDSAESFDRCVSLLGKQLPDRQSATQVP
jgi:hypothetical protein